MSVYEHETIEFARTKLRSEANVGAAPVRNESVPQVSNSNVARMLQREEAPEEEEVMAKHDDRLAQRHADTVDELQREEAPEDEEVMAKHDHASVQRHSDNGDELQREEAHDEDEIMAKHDHSSVQREPEVGLAGGAVSDGLAGRIDSARGGGSPLDDGTRSTMEDALGTSLGGVRVHVGSESDELNHAITAKAFTTGNDVFVRSDQWAPGSSETQRLMAHELTHVAQQREGVGSGESGMTVGAAETAEEHEADAVADAVTRT